MRDDVNCSCRLLPDFPSVDAVSTVHEFQAENMNTYVFADRVVSAEADSSS